MSQIHNLWMIIFKESLVQNIDEIKEFSPEIDMLTEENSK